ncbi:hypothetical protein [Niameybacter massiliensis]|uniref:hypothetical protein n=1 Tax=Niameybacter massiliensis TaxID=1658108 RepID=UPI0006B44565|nr:hypothetical protein [Niameybacter massiliensis]
MTDEKALQILKLFYFGATSVQEIERKVGLPRVEVREVLKGARSCDLINYSTQETCENFVNVRKKGLERYLRTKGIIQ